MKASAQTPLVAHYIAAGMTCQIATNFEPILEAAGESFFPAGASPSSPDLRLRFWVDPEAHNSNPCPKPYYRGLGHLVFAGFDSQNSVLMDLRARRAIGRFSPAMGAQQSFWKTVIFPVLLSVFSASLGVTELHCACVVRDGSGLLLAGGSGSGKSMLSLALTQSGFALLSDDRTYISRREGRLLAWGLPTLVKLRPDAFAIFPELSGVEPGLALSGEPALLLDPELEFHARRSFCCEPRWLVFLELQVGAGVALEEISPTEAAARLKEDLLPEAPEAAASQWATIDGLVRRGCWRLRCGDEPGAVARALAGFCNRAAEGRAGQSE